MLSYSFIITNLCDVFSEKEIKDDDYLVPYAHHEIALIRIAQGKFDEAKSLLDKIK